MLWPSNRVIRYKSSGIDSFSVAMPIQTPTSPAVADDSKTEKIKKQVDEVTNILQTNVEIMKSRGETFDSMQAKSSIIRSCELY